MKRWLTEFFLLLPIAAGSLWTPAAIGETNNLDRLWQKRAEIRAFMQDLMARQLYVQVGNTLAEKGFDEAQIDEVLASTEMSGFVKSRVYTSDVEARIDSMLRKEIHPEVLRQRQAELREARNRKVRNDEDLEWRRRLRELEVRRHAPREEQPSVWRRALDFLRGTRS